MTSSHANFHHHIKTHDNDYNDLMRKCKNNTCSYYFYYLGRTDFCESCRGLT